MDEGGGCVRKGADVSCDVGKDNQGTAGGPTGILVQTFTV